MSFPRARSAAPLMVGLVLALCGSAAAQNVTVTGLDRVTVRAEAVPLGALLTELSKLMPLAKLEIEGAQESLPVTLAVEGVPVRVALLLALRASGLDFMMTERQLWVGTTPKISDSGRDAASQAQAQPTRPIPEVDQRATPSRPPATTSPDPGSARDRDFGIFAGTPPAALDTAPPPALPDSPAAAVAPREIATEFEHMLPVRDAPFVVTGDTAVVTEPGFVPYKSRPEVQRLRLSTDVSTIP